MKNKLINLVIKSIFLQTILFTSPLILGGIMFILTSNVGWILGGIFGLFVLWGVGEFLIQYKQRKILK